MPEIAGIRLWAQPPAPLVPLNLIESHPDRPDLGVWFPDALEFEWSPDSTGIVYRSAVDELYTVDVDTLQTTRIGQGGQLSWGPRGILYRTTGVDGWGIAIVNPDSSGFALLLKDSQGGDGRVTNHMYPHWSPDGEHFVYRRGKGKPGNMNKDIIRVTHSGGSPR